MKQPPIILASTSPRRHQLLRQIGVEFEVLASGVSEDVGGAPSPRELVRTLAARKAETVSCLRPEALVIAADTAVVVGGKILGKPEHREDAVNMLRQLSGCTHQVVTGVAFLCLNR